MRTVSILATTASLSIAILAGCAVHADAIERPAERLATEAVPDPAWMAGAWVQQDGDRWADEYWTPPRAGIMIGAARMGKGDVLNNFEHTRIVRKGDGSLVFIAQPSGAPPSEFPMVASGYQDITFANAAHDYPQKVRYWRDGERLKARISLIDDSQMMTWDYAPMGPKN